MGNRSMKTCTCFAASLAVLMVSTGLSVAEDAPQLRMDPQFLEMLSTLQKKAAEASDAIVQNMEDASKNVEQSGSQAQKLIESLSDFQKKASEASDAIVQNMKDASKNVEQSGSQVQKFIESFSDFQKKAFGTNDSGTQKTK